jgi:hypothetical protein
MMMIVTFATATTTEGQRLEQSSQSPLLQLGLSHDRIRPSRHYPRPLRTVKQLLHSSRLRCSYRNIVSTARIGSSLPTMCLTVEIGTGIVTMSASTMTTTTRLVSALQRKARQLRPRRILRRPLRPSINASQGSELQHSSLGPPLMKHSFPVDAAASGDSWQKKK